MSILLWITTKMEYKIKYYNPSLLLPRVVINSTIKGLIINLKKKKDDIGTSLETAILCPSDS